MKGTAVEEVLGAEAPGGFNLDDDSFPDARRAVLNMDSATIDAKAADLRIRFLWDRIANLRLAAYRSLL
jgi:hypothetical protein